MVKQWKKNSVLFAVGGIGYGIMELLWRGRTHWSMLFAGGICFMMFASIAEKWRHRSIWFKAVLCAGGVTAVEFIFGLIFNVWLQRDVWDYSNKSFNVMGQICPVYSLLWGVVALGFIPLAEQINRRWKV